MRKLKWFLKIEEVSRLVVGIATVHALLALWLCLGLMCNVTWAIVFVWKRTVILFKIQAPGSTRQSFHLEVLLPSTMQLPPLDLWDVIGLGPSGYHSLKRSLTYNGIFTLSLYTLPYTSNQPEVVSNTDCCDNALSLVGTGCGLADRVPPALPTGGMRSHHQCVLPFSLLAREHPASLYHFPQSPPKTLAFFFASQESYLILRESPCASAKESERGWGSFQVMSETNVFLFSEASVAERMTTFLKCNLEEQIKLCE